jgi:hypothetical protein
MPSRLPGGVAASAVDGFGLFDDSYQSSDREIGAEALTENLTGPSLWVRYYTYS